jgi:hypothetical protein
MTKEYGLIDRVLEEESRVTEQCEGRGLPPLDGDRRAAHTANGDKPALLTKSRFGGLFFATITATSAARFTAVGRWPFHYNCRVGQKPVLSIQQFLWQWRILRVLSAVSKRRYGDFGY